MTMRNEVKKLVDAYIEKQRKSYEKTNNVDRCFHRFQGYIACLIDTNIISHEESIEVLDYMYESLENIEVK